MNSKTIRKKFFDYFNNLGHTTVPSSSLIPAEDPTLLFTNAGMNQFKDLFLGKAKRNYTKATSIQKCIRAGGKHNDLENVGFTRRHLTFFEMMGNFSFDDYFKKEAIQYAWDFLTKELKLDTKKLNISVYESDEESYNIWAKDIGINPNQIHKLGAADNFWSMGDTGPCGPCSEIYYDKGKEFGCKDPKCAPGCSCDRFLEIWNLVFMEFDRQPDGSDLPLKGKGVDTGMGLERLCSIMQNTDSIYETDLFYPLISKIENLTGVNYAQSDFQTKSAFKVISDHMRSSCFAIADGCAPSNDGRGYVLRKIIRRAALFAQKLGQESILPDLAPTLFELMGDIYPELKINADLIVSLLQSEVQKFSTSLINGQKILENYFEESKDKKTITGAQAFKLYDTFGFPLELTKVIASERGFDVNISGFEDHMHQQKIQSGKKLTYDEESILDDSAFTHFTGYDEHVTDSVIIGLVVNDKTVEKIPAGTSGYVITEHSPFYVECGGQISDQGYIEIDGKKAKLSGLKKFNKAIGAYVEAAVDMKLQDKVTLVVDSPSRINTMKNHTATHLLQAALITILGKTVKQSGSVVEPDYLRFDFTYHENLTPEQITMAENIVNKKIMDNIPLKIAKTTLKDAQEKGVIAFFGEKYNPEDVRVVEVPGFSAELCGGTHVGATGDIGVFKITEVGALSAGNRRIVAVTGPKALETFQKSFNIVKSLGQEFKVQSDEILDAVAKQKEQLKSAQQEIKAYKKQIYKQMLPEWVKQAQDINSVPFIYLELDNASSEDLRNVATDLLKSKSGLHFVVSLQQPRSSFLATISPEYSSKVNLKEFSSWLASQGIQGGGKANSIQGGAATEKIKIKSQIIDWLKNNIK